MTCVILLVAVLILQNKQQSQIAALQNHQDAIDSLVDRVAAFDKNLELHLAQNEQLKKEQTESEKTFREMRQQFDNIVTSGGLFPNKSKPAGEAVALAVAAEKAGNMDLAKIYYLSAINHAPSEFSILNNYAELVFRDSAAKTDDFERLKSVLQISLYQIPPENIENAIALLGKTVSHEEQLLAAQTPESRPVNWQERFDQLTKSNTLDKSWTDLKQTSLRWDGLNEIVESLREDQPGAALTKSAEHELALTQRVLTAARLASVMDVIMGALNSSSEQPNKAVSLLQTAEATLGQIWGIDSTGWPAALQTKVDQYPEDIKKRIDIVAEVKSRPPLEIIRKTLVDAKNYELSTASDKYQRALLHYDSCISNASEAAQSISSTEGRKEAQGDIKEIRDLALAAKQKQFDSYQKWVINVCYGAFYKYNVTNFTLDPSRTFSPTSSNTLATAIFDNAGIALIDQSMLSSETARLLNDVLGKLIGKMNAIGQFESEKKIAEADKKKLEDF